MSKIFDILKTLQLASMDNGDYLLSDLEAAKQQVKDLMLELIGETDFAYKDASAYAEVLKRKVSEL